MNKALAGKTVVVTRAAAQAAEFATALEDYGAKVFLCPTIEITDPESFDRLDEAIDHLYGYDWLIFTSVNGVDFFLRRLKARRKNVDELDELKTCAIGEATAERLRDAHIHVDVVPADFKAEGIFESLTNFVGGREKLHGLNILLPRAAMARDYLPKALEEAGARVDVVPAYRTVVPENVDRGRLSAMLAGDADCIAFTSSSTVRNFALLFDTSDLSQILSGLTIASIGDITAETAKEYGLTVHIQPEQFTIRALANAIADHYSTE
jgi:uroporphyrinogen III methyltransferase / synthase